MIEKAIVDYGTKLADKWWRMTSGELYKVKNKSGEIVPFIPNVFQAYYYKTKHTRNLFLKGRQVGVSTAIQLDYVDDMFFSGKNLMCGVITQDRESTQRLFEDKIMVAYDNLPAIVKSGLVADTDNANQLTVTNAMFGTTGTFRVATSFRSGTIQRLHVSELGPMAAKDPGKAREINSGSIEAVAIDGMVSVESTSSGDSGLFYDMCELYSRKRVGELSPLDFRFYFFPWHMQDEYEYNGIVTITEEYEKYFDSLGRDHGLILSPAKKNWYVLKSEQKRMTGRNDMFQEYPSVYKEAFWASTEGAYFDKNFDTIVQQGRIGMVPYNPAGFVYTAWDLGG